MSMVFFVYNAKAKREMGHSRYPFNLPGIFFHFYYFVKN